jgi:hypothetical protein
MSGFQGSRCDGSEVQAVVKEECCHTILFLMTIAAGSSAGHGPFAKQRVRYELIEHRSAVADII